MKGLKNAFNFIQFCKDFHVPYSDSESKHSRKGWIQVACPFCQDGEDHLGFNILQGYFNCWRCGWHGFHDTLSKLAPGYNRENVMRYMGGATIPRSTWNRDKPHADVCKLPPGSRPLCKVHKEYLTKRGFWNIEQIENTWGLRGTLGVGGYPMRIVIPILFNHDLVSYTGRDVTDRAKIRYLSCPLEKEVVHHKHIVYGYDLARREGNRVLIVEGPTSAWRIGPGTCATFGASVTNSQINLLRQFEKRYILMDNDKAGQESAAKLAACLSIFNGQTYILGLHGRLKDPAELSMKQVNELRTDIGMVI